MTSRAFTIEEACQRLGGRGRATVYQLINTKQLRSFKDGKRRLVPEDAISEYLTRKEREYAENPPPVKVKAQAVAA